MGLDAVRMLLVEDSASDMELILRTLRAAGIEPVYERVETADDMRRMLRDKTWDVVLSDYYLPKLDALAALAVLQEHGADIPFIVVSGGVGEDTAVAAMKAGATDYVMKDRLARLPPAIARAIEDARDRRRRRHLERQLQEANKLEAIGRLAGGVAHDFNNVLTAILGSTELLLLDSPPGIPTREELDIIREAATRAQDLIRQLLAFGARQVLQPVVLDLNDLVKNINRMLRRLIGEDIDLVANLAPELSAVRADPGQVEQVLVNLAVNARDAMPEGGRLTIETFEAEQCVALQISDTGTGMDDETQARIFEPFFTTKERGRGTGLGLATVYGIVRQSGGRITVRSAPGAGSTFRVYLPRADEPVAPPEVPAAIGEPTLGRETVLIAEDERLVRLLAKKVLEQAGYRVLVAAGGREALDLAQAFPDQIALLLTDMVMPQMNGRELAHQLTKMQPGVRVLYMTGYSDEAVARHGMLDAGTALIQKPFTPAALAGKVREVLARSSRVPRPG